MEEIEIHDTEVNRVFNAIDTNLEIKKGEAVSKSLQDGVSYESYSQLLPPLLSDAGTSLSSLGFKNSSVSPSFTASKKARRSKKRKTKKTYSKSSIGPTSPSDYTVRAATTAPLRVGRSLTNKEETKDSPRSVTKEEPHKGKDNAGESRSSLQLNRRQAPKPNSAKARQNDPTRENSPGVWKHSSSKSILTDDFYVKYVPKNTQSEVLVPPSMTGKPQLGNMKSTPISIVSPGKEGIHRGAGSSSNYFTESKVPTFMTDDEEMLHESLSISLENVDEHLSPTSALGEMSNDLVYNEKTSCWCACFRRRRKKANLKAVIAEVSIEEWKPIEKSTTKSHDSSKQQSMSTRKVKAEVNNVPLLGKGDQEDSLVFLDRASSISMKLLPRNTSLLVLDMDETLLHSTNKKIAEYDMLVMAGDNLEHEVYVKKRPYVDEFLKACSKFALIYVWTASNQNYADPVLDSLDKHSVVKKRFYKPNCTRYNKWSFDKPLSQIGHSLESTIIVDNSPEAWKSNPKNAIRVSSWFDNQYDTALLELIPVLETFFLYCNDVRNVLDGDRRSFKGLRDKAKKLNPAITAKYKRLEKVNRY